MQLQDAVILHEIIRRNQSCTGYPPVGGYPVFFSGNAREGERYRAGC